MLLLGSLSRDDCAIIFALPISYILVCIFSALHDTIHESGHGVVCRCRGSKVRISLGSFQCSAPSCSNEFSEWSIEAHGELFFRPLYRTSSTCCSDPCQNPTSSSSQESLIFVGGLFGLVGMWLICIIVCCFAILGAPRFSPKLPTNSWFALSLLRGVHIMAFLPEYWIMDISWPLWARWSAVFTCCFTQLDLLNELFYAFTPSRTVVGEWRPSYDGVRQWMVWTGVPPDAMDPQTISPAVRDSLWAVLLLLYVVHAARYIRLAILLQRGGMTSQGGDAQGASESRSNASTQGILVELPEPAGPSLNEAGSLAEKPNPALLQVACLAGEQAQHDRSSSEPHLLVSGSGC
jgi:hypothetical protein